MLSMSSRITASKAVAFCDLEDEIAILNTETAQYFTMNPVAARVWELIQEPAALSQICAIIEDEYEIDSEQCHHDLLNLIHKLADAGLVSHE